MIAYLANADDDAGGLTSKQATDTIMVMGTKQAKFTDQLRAIVEGCGKSRYRLAKETGIDEATLSRFVHGERGLSSKAQDALGACLGLKVVMEKPPAKKGR